MIIIEAHDNQLDNIAQGTLAGTVGRKNGTIEYDYQAEQWLSDISEDGYDFSRAYFLRDGEPVAAWRHNANKSFSCIGHTNDYDGAWRTETPYVYEDTMLIIAAHLGREVLTVEQGQSWANERLIGAFATAVLLDKHGILAAWERDVSESSETILVARGPQRVSL
ncbi:MAG TPA: hypothetical protein VLG16_01935 [Candidatus Saccharimonadales bacterium]|nr:hypothetical protein [Candidatus Saccharimonadales bacterium]